MRIARVALSGIPHLNWNVNDCCYHKDSRYNNLFMRYVVNGLLVASVVFTCRTNVVKQQHMVALLFDHPVIRLQE